MKESPFVVGVSGHQNLGNETTQSFVVHHFRELLSNFQRQEHHLLLYSSLAPGADQLFVRMALEQGVPVQAVIPCYEYEAIFRSEEERDSYKQLLQACQQTHHLPDQQCSEDAFLVAGQWIVAQSDVMILAWNGLPPRGRGGTGDIAAYARLLGRPFIHLDTIKHSVKRYGDIQGLAPSHTAPRRSFVKDQRTVYQGDVLTVNQYHIHMPDGQELTRDIVERPESVLVLPVGQKDILLLAEEYDLGAGQWQLTIPGGKVEHTSSTLEEQVQRELRQEVGYRAGRLEKLVEFYGHPGYVFHRVHIFLAFDLEWDPLELEKHEEINIQTMTLKEALEATQIANRCDPEASLAIWLYAQKRYNFIDQLNSSTE